MSTHIERALIRMIRYQYTILICTQTSKSMSFACVCEHSCLYFKTPWWQTMNVRHSWRETESSLYFKHRNSVSVADRSLERIIKNSFLKYLPFLRNFLFLKCVKDPHFSSPIMFLNNGEERRN